MRNRCCYEAFCSKCPGICMPADKRVTSYRVRDFDETHYVVETYTMRFCDEWLSYAASPDPSFADGVPDPSYYRYYIQYRSTLRTRGAFQRFLLEQCSRHNYYDRYDNSWDLGDTERLNFFLATHYFVQGISGPYDNETVLNALNALNERADQYMRSYDSTLRERPYRVDTDAQLSRARALLGGGIAQVACMNVGQANCSIGCRDDGHPCAVFDIGVRSSNLGVPNRNHVKRILSELDEHGIVVISHYDFDHINGYRHMSPQAADRVWVLPERRPSPSPAERSLLTLLRPQNCIFLPNVEYDKTPFDPNRHVLRIGNLDIYQGNGKKVDPFQSTDENARSLLCFIKRRASLLLPADCLYEEFPTTFAPEHLAVPHHACFYDKPPAHIDASRLKELIVFAGPHRRYGHPDLAHINLYSQPAKTIYLTNNSKFCFDRGAMRSPLPQSPTWPSHLVPL